MLKQEPSRENAGPQWSPAPLPAPLSEAVEEATVALVSDLELDCLLQRLTDLARGLVSAQYGALAVMDQDGRVRQFLTSGMQEAERAAIGPLPQGNGLLGTLLKETAAIRIRDISMDTRSVGFPPNHPAMTSFLGVPVILKGENVGNLYLTNKQGAAEFTAEDEEAVVRLARFAAVAIGNARLHQEALLAADRWRLLAELAHQTTTSLEPRVVLQEVVEQARKLLETDTAFISLVTPDGQGVTVVAASGTRSPGVVGLHIGQGIGALVVNAAKPVYIPDYATDERVLEKSEVLRAEGVKSVLAVPFSTGQRLLGVLNVANRSATVFTDDQAKLLEALASLAALVVEHGRMYEHAALLRQRAEEEAQRLQAVIETIPNGVFITNSAGDSAIVANQTALRILGEKEPGFSPWKVRLFRPDGTPLPLEERRLSLALRGEVAPPLEMLVERPDGSRVPVIVAAAPLPGQQGQVTGVVLVFQDISTVKQAEQMKEDFLAMVSHDLRTPLATIKTIAASLSQESRISRMKAQELAHALDREVDRLANMVTNLLDMSRIQAGTAKPEPEECHILDIVQDALRELELANLAADRQVSLHIPDTLPTLFVDFEHVRRVLSNLLSNALKYSPPDSPVQVRAWHDSKVGKVMVAVADNGVGIAAEDLLRIFEKFYRQPGKDSHGRKGTGLGLAISKALVELNGGRIWAESTPGAGSTFYFELPIDGGSGD